MIAADGFLAHLRSRGIDFFCGVPDSLLKSFCACLTETESGNHVITANEGGAIGLAAGHYLATGKLACVYMQNSGQGNAVNPLASLADPDVYSIPMVLLVGWRGEPGVPDEPQHVKQGKVTLALFETLGIPAKVLPADEYTREQKKRLVEFLVGRLKKQYGEVENDDFGRFSLQRIFAKEVQRHALATRREYVAALSARQVAERMVHLVAAPNEELNSVNGIRHFEYGLAKVRIGTDLYLAMGIVGVRQGSAPYYDQHIVAKFKADSEASSIQGHMRIGESAFERIYDNRFRLIRARGRTVLSENGKIRGMKDGGECQRMSCQQESINGVWYH